MIAIFSSVGQFILGHKPEICAFIFATTTLVSELLGSSDRWESNSIYQALMGALKKESEAKPAAPGQG